MPKISVIVPVYKVEQYLHECVDSILAQTFTDFELILVDDGSPDNCGKICDEYAAKDSRVRVIHQENQGVSAARNAALDVAKGEFIAFIDSDDVVNVYYLEVLLSGMDEDTDIVACPFFTFSEEPADIHSNLVQHYFMKNSNADAIMALYRNANSIPIAPGGKLFRMATIGDTRFPIGRIHEDQYFIPLVYYKARLIARCNLAMYHYRIQSQSITHSIFSVKRFDDIWAIDFCINYFKDAKEHAIVRAAEQRREHLLVMYGIYAKNAGVEVPKPYRVGIFRSYRHLSRTMEPQRCQYYLAQIHPTLARIHEYEVKLKEIFRIRNGDKNECI